MLILLCLTIFLGVWLLTSYNELVTLKEACAAAASNIQTQIARRFDLYVKASEVLSQGSEFEKNVFKQVTELRSRNDISLEQKVSEIGRIFAVAESNPNVNSVNLFGSMQQAIIETETLIQKAREVYNTKARTYNTKIKQFPTNIAASILSFKEERYFAHSSNG